ncbi:zinc ribbon domain-containing protein [Bradymonas sediminis]|uniref:Uncharacterized protein n=1 Tax=Bradymonas sediminis TaxID=1548548 RepID=A0A2Z4FMD3_9DELT|nr:zinc ribbon domain-containing protein [Bradymonas sediminis]AWV89916.1 hypothetical protein DN745_11425 [Bradymonas sediminis]TDP62018.1 zinc ribbon protein [Bradymonas sediminis]
MTPILVLIAIVFTLVMLYQTVRPFLRSQQERVRFEVLDDDLRRVGELAARKAGLLESLRELEFDYSTGKLTDEDFAAAKSRYERAALKTMRALDELHGGRGWEAVVDKELSKHITVARQQEQTAQHQEVAPKQPAPLAEALIECHECGKELEADARFCSKCGTTVEQASTADSDERKNSSTLSNSGSEVTI